MKIDFSDLEKQVQERGSVFTLDNGMTVISEHVPNSGLAYGNLIMSPGGYIETSENQGLMHFLEHMCFDASKKFPSREERSLRAGQLGMNMNAGTSYYSIVFNVLGGNGSSYLLSEHFPEALSLIKDIAFDPVFTEEGLNREKSVVLRELAQKQQAKRNNAFQEIQDVLQDRLYSNNLLKLRDGLGTQENIVSFTLDQLRACHDKYFGARNGILQLVGDTRINGDLIGHVDSIFGDVKPGEKTIVYQDIPEDSFNGREVIVFDNPVCHDGPAYIGVNFRAPSITSKDYATNQLANFILGEGMNSILFHELRDKRGLVYSHDSSLTGDSQTGLLQISYQVDRDKIEESLEALDIALTRLKEGYFPSELVDGFRANKLPTFLQMFQNPGWIQRELHTRYNKQFQPSITTLEATRQMIDVTKEDAIRIANAYLGEDRLTTIIK